jgi:dephospho-CoA kinase
MSLRRVKLKSARGGACTRSHKRRRKQNAPGVIIGLTGSVAMGKSTAAMLLRYLGVPVFDADAAVHVLLGPAGKAIPAVHKNFPDVVGSRGVDRKALGAKVFADARALAALEAIIHPLVKAERAKFLARAVGRRRVVALDIPLLFEGKTAHLCDVVVVVSAPAFLQRQRAMARPGMTASRFEGTLKRQWPDARKRRHADVVIPTSLGKRETLRRLKQLLTLLKANSLSPQGYTPHA